MVSDFSLMQFRCEELSYIHIFTLKSELILFPKVSSIIASFTNNTKFLTLCFKVFNTGFLIWKIITKVK